MANAPGWPGRRRLPKLTERKIEHSSAKRVSVCGVGGPYRSKNYCGIIVPLREASLHAVKAEIVGRIGEVPTQETLKNRTRDKPVDVRRSYRKERARRTMNVNVTQEIEVMDSESYRLRYFMVGKGGYPRTKRDGDSGCVFDRMNRGIGHTSARVTCSETAPRFLGLGREVGNKE
ncbi:hypothetical protein Trydic_g10610 [Trypoxylus dichotomus]